MHLVVHAYMYLVVHVCMYQKVLIVTTWRSEVHLVVHVRIEGRIQFWVSQRYFS